MHNEMKSFLNENYYNLFLFFSFNIILFKGFSDQKTWMDYFVLQVVKIWFFVSRLNSFTIRSEKPNLLFFEMSLDFFFQI